MTDKITHYGSANRRKKFEYYTMNAEPDGSVFVYGWGVYERSSVLAGQAMKKGLDHFDTAAEAIEVYGEMNYSSKWTEPGISLNHLPGENDFVPGGAYPDDFNDGW